MKKHKTLIKDILVFLVGISGVGLLIVNAIMVGATWSDIYHRTWELNGLGIAGIILSVAFTILNYTYK